MLLGVKCFTALGISCRTSICGPSTLSGKVDMWDTYIDLRSYLGLTILHCILRTLKHKSSIGGADTPVQASS